jgi:hypothetical protein
VIVIDPPAVADDALAVTRYFAAAPATVVIGKLLPVTVPVVAVMTWLVPAAVAEVKPTVAEPLALVTLVGEANDPPLVLVQVIVCPGVASAFPFPSTSCAVIVTAVPTVGEREVEVTRYLAGFPLVVVIDALVPVRPPASLALTVWTVAAVVLVANWTFATPEAFVLLVGDAKDPPGPVALHVTVCPPLATLFPSASVSWAVIVTAFPATTVGVELVTTYFAALPAIVVIGAPLPEADCVCAVTTWFVPAVVFVVKVTVAMPEAFVDDVDVAKLPPFVLDHVTVCPIEFTALPAASASCALMLTAAPATTDVALAVTTNRAAVPAVVVIWKVLPVRFPVVAVTTWVVPTTVLVVNEMEAEPALLVTLVVFAKEPPFVLLHVIVCPLDATALPFASTNCAVIVTAEPATTLDVAAVTRYCVAVPATIDTGELVPVRFCWSVPVNEYVWPAVVLVVYSTVASPCAFVVDDTRSNVSPPVALELARRRSAADAVLPFIVRVQLTTWPAEFTGWSFASTSCAAMVTVLPATTLAALGVTRYFTPFEEGAATVPIGLVRPISTPVVAVTTCDTPLVELVVNTTSANPLLFVTLVGVANDPPFVLDQATVWLPTAIGFPAASASCARIVTDPPAGTLSALALATYCVGRPGATVMIGEVPVIAPVVAETRCVTPVTLLAVSTAVATPAASVVLVGAPSAPPFVVVHVTIWLGTPRAFPNASVSFADIVTEPPAGGAVVLAVTTYFAAGPATTAIGGLAPVVVFVVALTTWIVPATVATASVTVATPLASVVDVDADNVPPSDADHATDWPAVAMALPFASTSRAKIVAVPPAVTLEVLDETT